MDEHQNLQVNSRNDNPKSLTTFLQALCLNCVWLALLMILCWGSALENESQLHHHWRLHSCQGYYAQRGSSCSFQTCMLGIRDGQLSPSPVKAIWREGKRYVSCNGDGNVYCCVILFTATPQFCQGLLKQAFLLLMHKVALFGRQYMAWDLLMWFITTAMWTCGSQVVGKNRNKGQIWSLNHLCFTVKHTWMIPLIPFCFKMSWGMHLRSCSCEILPA